jgi:hypothetical protein
MRREDFKYPYRVITRQEEIEGGEALGWLLGKIISIPVNIIDFILFRILPEKFVNLAWVVMIASFISYLIFF